MSTGHESTLHVLETELADPKSTIWNQAVLFRIRGLIPSVDVEFTKPDETDRHSDPRFRRSGYCRCRLSGESR